MATNPRPKNPNETALSAVEDALRLDYTPDETRAADLDEPVQPERRPEQRIAAPEAARRGERRGDTA